MFVYDVSSLKVSYWTVDASPKLGIPIYELFISQDRYKALSMSNYVAVHNYNKGVVIDSLNTLYFQDPKSTLL